MKLVRVRIKNFRSVVDAAFEVDPSFLVLVGINESGKSSVLKALSFLDPSTKHVEADARLPGVNEPPVQDSYVQFDLRPTQAEIAADCERAKKIVQIDDAEPLFFLRQQPITLAQAIELNGRRQHSVDVKTGLRTTRRAELPPDLVPSPDILTLMRDNAGEPLLQNAPVQGNALVSARRIGESTAKYFQRASAEEIWAACESATPADLLPRLPQIIFWRHSDDFVLPSSVDIQRFIDHPNEYPALLHVIQLGGFESPAAALGGVPSGTQRMRNILAGISAKCTNHIRKCWPEFEKLKITLYDSGANLVCSVADAENLFEMTHRSDGFKRFATFLLMISARVSMKNLLDAVFLQDEPDLGLHPSAIRCLRQELIRISETNTVICSTHSIFMVDPEELRRHLIVKRVSERTTVEVASPDNIQDEEVVYQAMGFSAFESLPRNNIIFEGFSDRLMFRAAVRSSAFTEDERRDLRRIGVSNGRGASDTPRFYTLMEFARRRWLVISDGDPKARSEQSRFLERANEYGSWKRYDEILGVERGLTCEDLLAEEYYMHHARILLHEHGVDHSGLALAAGEPRLEQTRKFIEAARAKNAACDVKAVMKELKERLSRHVGPEVLSADYYAVARTVLDWSRVRQDSMTE